MDTPRLCINQSTTRPLSFEQDLDVFEAAGHSRIELCTEKLAREPEVALDQLRLLCDRGFTIASVQPAVHAVFPDRMAAEPRDPEARLERYREDLTRIKQVFPDLQVSCVVITGAAPSEDFEGAQRTLRKLLPPLADFAADHGLRLAFETIHPFFMHRDTFIYCIDEAQRLLDDVARDNVGLVIDFFHVWQEINVMERLAQLTHRIDVAHVCDWPDGGPRALDDRAIPGQGQIDLPVMLAALREQGFEGPWVLELLSDRSLGHSLWKRDPGRVLRESQVGFARAWDEATRRMHATAGTPTPKA